MSSRFKDKLRQIRDAGARRSEISHKTRTEEDLQRSRETVKAFEFREGIEAIIEDMVTNFQAEAPGFVLTRGFYEGKYMLALRLDEKLLDEKGEPDSYYSRLMFLLAPESTSHVFSVQCRKTIRNRDLETVGHVAPMESTEMASFSEFIEEQFIAFAEGYFGETTLTRPSSVPS